MLLRAIGAGVICGWLVWSLSGCAVGYVSDHRAVGVSVGQAVLSECVPAVVKQGAVEVSGQKCRRIGGGTVSEAGSSLLGRLFDLIGTLITGAKLLVGG